MDADTRSRILSVLAKFLLTEGELERVGQGGDLFASSALDSLALVNLVVALENEFSVQIDTEDIDGVFANLTSLADYLDGKRAC